MNGRQLLSSNLSNTAASYRLTNQTERNPIRQKFNIVPPATKPFQTLHLDIFTAQNEKYLIFIDVFSKYGQAYQLRDGTAISILQALLHLCTHHGLPLTIVTDNGTEFTNQLFAECSVA